MSEPRTKAGQALIEEWYPGDGDGLDPIDLAEFRSSILAIEAEAAVPVDDDLRAALALATPGPWRHIPSAVMGNASRIEDSHQHVLADHVTNPNGAAIVAVVNAMTEGGVREAHAGSRSAPSSVAQPPALSPVPARSEEEPE